MEQRRRMIGLEPICFQHGMDRALLDKLNKLPILPKLSGWLLDQMTKDLKYELTGGGSLVVTAKSSPDLWQVYNETCIILGLSDIPPLYVVSGSEINAFTMGADKPVVCITNFAVNSCSDDELRFILGHELGHCMCDHVRFYNLGQYLAKGVGLSVKGLATAAIGPLLMKWSRCSEVTADRAGLLACQDFETCCAAFLKLCGFPRTRKMPDSPSDVLRRQIELHQDEYGDFGLARRLWKEVSFACTATHPRMVERYACLRDWIDLGYYDELLAASPEQRRGMAKAIAEDFQRHDILILLAMLASGCLERKFGVLQRESLSHVRRAFLFGESLSGTPAQKILMADLIVRKRTSDELIYELQIYFKSDGDKVVKTAIEVPYDHEWERAPVAFRRKFIMDREDELKVAVYQVGKK